jgi:hypothetical protein
MASPAADTVTVFVNERPVRVSSPGDLAAAVRAADPTLATALDDGRAYLTDGRGIACGPTDSVVAGAIIRVVISARRREPDADA